MEQEYEGLKLTPLFWSEISSSYLVHDIFEHHKDVAKEFIGKFLGLSVDSSIEIGREKPLLNKGSVDLLINFEIKGIKSYILMEVKVHDYASATKGQIMTYYDAALEKFKGGKVYFIYLTQFNKNNFLPKGVELPMTIREFEDGQKSIGEYKSRLRHVTWEEWHKFIKGYRRFFSDEENLMLDLQEKWITAKCKKDLEDKKTNVGGRDISHYFGDIYGKLIEELGLFGKTRDTQKRSILEIDLSQSGCKNLAKIFSIINELSDSGNVDKNVVMDTNDFTLSAVREFLNNLLQDQARWGLLSFYSSVFSLINEKKYLKLDGSGASGFSIKVKIKGKGEISLCTLWCVTENIIEFSLKR